jgi:hypothetical protein
MKYLFILFTIFLFGKSLNAQNWESLPLHFEPWYPSIMYYDSIEDISYIGGKFHTVNDTICNLVKWNGSQHTLLPSAPFEFIYTMARYNGKLFVGGEGLATWDGSTWTNISLSTQGTVYDLYVYNNKLYATGLFSSIAGQPIGKIAVWNDTVWTDLGRADTLLPDNDAPYTFTHYKDKFYVAGNFGTLNSTINEIAMFDGERWTDVGNFPLSAMGNVYKLLVWNDTLYVAGMFSEQEGGLGNGILKWDGANWHKLNNGILYNGSPSITDLMVHNNELYICGRFDEMDNIYLGTGHKGVAKWDGSRWCWLGGSANNAFGWLGQWRNEWYALGAFTEIDNQPLNKLAHWIGDNYTDTCSQPQVVGVSKINSESRKLSVYPNPTDGLFDLFFDYSGNPTIIDLKVIDITGKLINNRELKVKSGINNFNLDYSSLASGIYIIQIAGDNFNGSVKVVKH